METKKVVMIVGLVLLLLFFMRHISVSTVTPTTTKTSKTVVYRNPSPNYVGVTNPHYNSYKSQYYN